MRDWKAEAEARGRALDALGAELRAALAARPDWSEATYQRGLFTGKWAGQWDAPDYTARELTLSTHDGKDLTPTIHAFKKRRGGGVTDELYAATVAEALAWIDTPRSETTITERAKEAEMRALEAAAAPKRVDLAGLAATKGEAGRNGKGQTFQVLDVDGIGRVRLTLAGADLVVTLNRRRVTVPDPGMEGRGQAVRAAVESILARA